jgi:GntR family transcriptional regulator
MDFQNNKAIYLQIADYLCDNILGMKWSVAERIPSVRDLASILEVNPNTVLRAFDFLQNKEIIENKRGIGYFVSQNAVNLIKEYRRDIFFNEESLTFFKNMILLDISLEEINNKFKEFSNNYNK